MYRTLALFSLLVLSLGFASAATVTGKVVGEDGKPINGVNLVLRRFDDGSTQSLVPDAAGSFAIEVDLNLLPTNGLIGNIVAGAPGYVLAGAMLKERDNVITLTPGSTLSGTVVDAHGKPLAGIPVRLLSLQHNNDYADVPDEWRDRFTVSTAANGAWTLPGIPPQGTVSIAVADDRYVHEQQDITLVNGKKADSVSFTVRPGAVLTGRVLTPEGTPATDTIVTIANSRGASDETAAGGSYCFPGLATGTYTIYAYSKKQAWIADPLKEIALLEGKETRAADLRTRAGAILEGTVQDAETGAAIAGRTTIILSNGHTQNNNARRFDVSADKQGYFHLRMQPGQMKLRIDNPPRGYLKQQDTEALPLDLQDGKTVTVVLKLHKGLTVTGTVTDEKGKPVAGMQFYIHMPSGKGDTWSPNDTQVQFTTDQNGHFEVAGLPAGKGTINLFMDYRQIAAWEQAAPLPIEVPAKLPIAVSITRVPMHTVSGRVVDSQRHPLAGVKATFIVPLSPGLEPKKLTIITDANGGYQLADIPVKDTINLLSLEKQGYRQLFTSTLTSSGNGTIDDAVMSACNATVHGKVCDADGKPVQGATLVSIEGGLAVRATTDATGAFTLTEQPEDELLHLIAATSSGGGLATCKANDTNVTLTCDAALIAKPVDIPLARQLLEADSKLPKEQRMFNRSDTLHEIADRDFALGGKLALSGEEPLSDGLRAYLLGKQAEQEPAKVPEVVGQLNMLHDPDCKLYAAVELGIAVATTVPDLAEQLYQIAKPIYDHSPHGQRNGFKPIEGLGTFADVSLRTIALAGLLHKTADVDAMLAPLNVLAKQNPGMSYMITQPLFAAAGRVSPEFVIKVYQSIDTPFKFGDLREAVASMATQGQTEQQRLLKMMDAMKPAGEGVTHFGPDIRALGKHDPAAALALAKASSQSSQLLAAAAFQPKAVAHTIILNLFSEERNRTIANFAQANAVDAEIGKELYTQYKTTLEAQSYNSTQHGGVMDPLTNVGRIQYAYLISSIDPVEARLILETEYAGVLARAQHGERVFALQFFPEAMYALDIERAQAMLEAINGFDPISRQYCWQQIMQYILMPREERVASTYYSP